LGVANTARVITTAALIMIAVYASFVTNANPTVKLIGFGMAVAVLIDSTLLRMVLVPAVMELFGKAAWWFPRWLEWVPHVHTGGTTRANAGLGCRGGDGNRGRRDSYDPIARPDSSRVLRSLRIQAQPPPASCTTPLVIAFVTGAFSSSCVSVS